MCAQVGLLEHVGTSFKHGDVIYIYISIYACICMYEYVYIMYIYNIYM